MMKSKDELRFKTRFVKIIIIFFFQIQIQYAQEVQASQDFIFSALPIQIVKSEQVTYGSQQMILVESQNLVLLNYGEKGIGILNELQNKLSFKKFGQNVEYISVFGDDNYLLVALQQNLQVYLMINIISEVQLIKRNEININQIRVSKILDFPKSKKVMVLGLYGDIIIYKYNTNGNLFLEKQFLIEYLIPTSAVVSQDEQYFFIGTNSVFVQVYRIKTIVFEGETIFNDFIQIIELETLYELSQILLIEEENIFMYYIDYWKGLYYVDLQNLNSYNEDSIKHLDGNHYGLETDSISLITNCMIISKKKTYLFIGIRSQGVLIYDIKQKTKPILYFQIFVDTQVYDLALSSNEDILYFSNSNGLYKHQKIVIQLDKQVPHLFNHHKSRILLEGGSFYKWRCQITSNQIFYGSFDTEQLQRFKINKNDEIQDSFRLEQLDILPYSSEINQMNLAYINTVTIDKNEEYLIVPIYNEKYVGIKYQIPKDNRNQYSPLIVNQFLKVDDPQYAETARISSDNKYIVFSYQNSILLIDYYSFQVIVQFYIPEFFKKCSGVDFTQDTNYIIATARNIGIFIISIENINQPKIIEIINTKGGETVKASKIYNIMYILDGQNGLIIIESSFLPKIKILCEFKLQGWANDITLLSSENYAIISTMDRGMIWLINIKDKINPFLIQKYQIDSQNSYSTCIDPLMKYMLILNSSSIRYLPLISSSLIHYECSLKSIDDTDYSKRIINEGDYLQVGYSYEIRMISIYTKKNQSIMQAYLFQNYKKLELPNWIKRITDSYFEMTVPKISLIETKNSFDKVFNLPFCEITLIVKTAFSIQEDSFIFTIGKKKTSTKLSKRLYIFLKTNSFLDIQNYLTDYFNPEAPIDFHDFQDDITDLNQQQVFLQLARDILQNGIDYSTVSWKVKSSLFLSYKNETIQYMVNTFSSTVSIQFSFNSSQSLVFVDKKYPNVVIYKYQQDTIMSFESTKENINALLSQKVIYHNLKKDNSTQQNDKLIISILLADGVNDNVDLQFRVMDLPFLSLKQEIQIKNQLQPQIKQISSDYDFTIDNYLLIEFNQTSFFDPDGIKLQYKLLIYQNGNYGEIPLLYFLKFDYENLRLAGTPTSNDLFSTIHFRLVASNGYTEMYDDFYLSINKISITYFLNQFFKILGPIAFFLGFYRQRRYFINLIWKNRTFYSDETAYVDNIYRKKITLLGDELIIAQLFFSKFCNKVQQKSSLKTDKCQTEHQSPIIYLNVNDKEDNFVRRKSNFNQTLNPFLLSQKNVSYDYIENDSGSKLSLSKVNRKSSMSKIIQRNLSQKLQKRFNSQPYLYIKPILSQIKKLPSQNDQNFQLQQNDFSINKDQNSPLNDDITYKLSYQEQQRAMSARKNLQDARKRKKLENDVIYNLCIQNTLQIEEYSQNFQKISTIALFNQMIIDEIEIFFKNKKIKISDYIQEYKNTDSRFHFSLHACVVNYLLRQDISTCIVYKYVKEYAQKSLNYNNNDWYKAYVIVEATNELDCNGFSIPFSKIIVKEQNFIPCFSHLQIYDGKLSFFNNIQDYEINPHLLRDALIYDSLGLLIHNQNISFMNYAHGESIHLSQDDIFSVEAFNLKDDSRMICLRKIFNLEYQRMPISKYQSLPSWIKYDCKNGVIILEGVPTQSDMDEILIRVFNRSYCVVKQFFLKISDENLYDIDYIDEKSNQSQDNFDESHEKISNSDLMNDDHINEQIINQIQPNQNTIIEEQKKKDFTFNKIPTKLSDQNHLDIEQQQFDQLNLQYKNLNLKQLTESQNNKFRIFLLEKFKKNSKYSFHIANELDSDKSALKNKKKLQSRKTSNSLSHKSQYYNNSPIQLKMSQDSHIKHLQQNSSFVEDYHNLPKLSDIGAIKSPFDKKK